jgi:hypothetical protein
VSGSAANPIVNLAFVTYDVGVNPACRREDRSARPASVTPAVAAAPSHVFSKPSRRRTSATASFTLSRLALHVRLRRVQ